MKKQRHYFANKDQSSQGYDFSSSHVWMWQLDYKESWALKNWCFWTVVLEKILESPLDCKYIQPVHPKRDQSWVFIGRTDVEAETPILWSPDVNSWLIWKDPDAGIDWRQEEKGMAGWDGWMASLTQWRCVWVNSGSWWWTGRPGLLWSTESWRVGHDWATELSWTEPKMKRKDMKLAKRYFHFFFLEPVSLGNLKDDSKRSICVSTNEVDEPRFYYTEWRKSERERQISHINAYIWNPERWYHWSYG